MGAIEIAVLGSRRLETILESAFGASGKGLHEKVTSVEGVLPIDLVRSIRWVAGVRNRVVHEDGASLRNVDEFQRTVDRIVERLSLLASRSELEREFVHPTPSAGSPAIRIAQRAGIDLRELLKSDQRTVVGRRYDERRRLGEWSWTIELPEPVRICLVFAIFVAFFGGIFWLLYELLLGH